MKKKNLVHKSSTNIPLVRASLKLFIAKDPCRTFEETAEQLFGFNLSELPRSFHARAVRGNGEFGLYFHAHNTDHDDISHEVRHVVNYILGFLGHEEGTQDEFGPRLSGFIAGYVYRQFQKSKLRIRY